MPYQYQATSLQILALSDHHGWDQHSVENFHYNYMRTGVSTTNLHSYHSVVTSQFVQELISTPEL